MNSEEQYIELIGRVAKIDVQAVLYMRNEAREQPSFIPRDNLRSCFQWNNTPQGRDYWDTIYQKLVSQRVVYVSTKGPLDNHSALYIQPGRIYKAILAESVGGRNPYHLLNKFNTSIYIRLKKCNWVSERDWELRTEEEYLLQEGRRIICKNTI